VEGQIINSAELSHHPPPTISFVLAKPGEEVDEFQR
jgi:hypothetical protein